MAVKSRRFNYVKWRARNLNENGNWIKCKKKSKSMKEVIYFSFLSTQQENNYSCLGVKMTPPRHVFNGHASLHLQNTANF